MTIHCAYRLRAALKSSASSDWSRFAASGMGAGLLLALCASPALANPAIGSVTTGKASIASSSSKTQIDQKSEDVVIDWSSFNIGAGQTTQFVQPNAQAIAVNRIGGNSASQILGTLDANGRIVLINGNGMLFGKGSQVNVGSLVATSTSGFDSDVLSGKFTQAGKQNAAVVNQGSIRTSQGGLVALVAPNVTNAGMVNARFGTVAMGAANKFTVDFKGDGLVSFAAQGDVTGTATAANTGSLAGANVSLTAHAAEGVATGVVNMSGIAVAQTARDAGGTILLDAGNGSLSMTGKLDAAGQSGRGNIETSGNQVAISGTVTAGQGGQWKIDPENLTVDATAARTIERSLNHDTDVELQTTADGTSGPGTTSSGVGDIDIASTIGWKTNATLNLDAYHSINVLAPIKITGAGALALTDNDEATDGTLNISGSGRVIFSDVVAGVTQGALSIDGTSYTLVNNIATLASDIAANSNGSSAGGDFALADNYNAANDGTYSQSAIPTTFTGTLEGLGNTISHFSIDDTSNTADQEVGLFAELFTGGAIADLHLTDVSIKGGHGAYVGGLVGASNGDLVGDSVTGKLDVKFGIISEMGGLVGQSDYEGTVSDSWSSANINGMADEAGGLVGENDGELNSSYATGRVSGSHYVGGLAGTNNGSIDNSYATGAVTNRAANGAPYAGGLVGENHATISDSYSTGTVTGRIAGGLVGYEDSGTLTDDYWDTTTSGITALSQGCGSSANCSGVTGLSTTQLQSGLPVGFSAAIWGESNSIDNGLPYLLALPPS